MLSIFTKLKKNELRTTEPKQTLKSEQEKRKRNGTLNQTNVRRPEKQKMRNGKEIMKLSLELIVMR
jgi:hypothetical protein